MVAFGEVKKKTYELVETGEYVFTLNDLGDISGDYGDRLTWDFLFAFKDSPTDYICRQDGNEHRLRFFTDVDIVIGSRQHQWIQALTGRTLKEGDAPPAVDDLLGKRMTAYLTHYTPKRGKNQGVPREDIVDGSAKSFTLGSPRSNGSAAKKTAPVADEEPSIDREAVIVEIKKQIKRAALADVDEATVEAWQALDLEDMPNDDLVAGLETIKARVKASLES